MKGYIIRRLIYMLLTAIGLSIFIFILIQLPPGNVADAYLSKLSAAGEEVSTELYQSVLKQYNFDKPLYMQYLYWMSGFFTGDFGDSVMYHKPILDVIGERLLLTMVLSFSTILFTYLVSIPIGIYSATHQYSIQDHVLTLFAFIGRSIPNFLLALVLLIIAVFYFDTSVSGLFSEEYINAPWTLAKIIDLFKHLWIPILVIGTGKTAGGVRVMRGNLLDELNLQYVMTARAKGLRENVVILKHAVRNALHPQVMSLGGMLPAILSGSTITSIVLSLPTMGPVQYEAILNQDMYLACTILLFQVILLLIGYLVSDLLLAVVDPRIKYE